MIVVVECLHPFCPKPFRGGAGRQHIGRVLVRRESVVAELYCHKCRIARWYEVGVDGSTRIVGDPVVASTPRPRVLSSA